jgi:hypothetical protein
MAYGEATYDALVAASGAAVVAFGPTSRAQTWTVSQVSVEMAAAPIGATCALRRGDRLVTLLIPTGDVAGGDPPVVLRGGETLTVQWGGCTAGDIGHVFVIYDDGR